MVVDGNTFVKRARRFFSELAARKFPNAATLAKLCNCSNNTAQRTIYRLRDEFLVPLEYDASEKGYYIADPNYALPTLLPPGKDELTALLLARDIVGTLDAADLHEHLDSLWQQYTSSNSHAAHELEPLSKVFSCDSTVIGDIADMGLLRFVFAAAAGESVRVSYRSPWRHSEDKVYEGRIGRVHLSDGSLYLLFREKSGRERILNSAFVKEFTVLDYTVAIAERPEAEAVGTENWLDGFGVWAGQALDNIVIRILPPASIYYASQRWHAEQEDSWEGQLLVRRMPGIVSPEIARRVLSLGRFVHSVEPKELRELVVEDARGLVAALGADESLS